MYVHVCMREKEKENKKKNKVVKKQNNVAIEV